MSEYARSSASSSSGSSTGFSFHDDLSKWAQPLIVDQINNFYFRRLAGRANEARELAIVHYRVWRQILRDDLGGATSFRNSLAALARETNIDAAWLDQVDRAVLNELMDVIVNRFQRTPYLARSYGMSLLDAATIAARTRAAAL